MDIDLHMEACLQESLYATGTHRYPMKCCATTTQVVDILLHLSEESLHARDTQEHGMDPPYHHVLLMYAVAPLVVGDAV